MADGKFIVFEGLDGSGKSTQLELYAAHLRDRGVEPVCTAEPWGEGGMREVLRVRPRPGGACPEEMVLLYAADRLAHLALVVEPALAQSKVVLCDRYVLSSYAYQAAGATNWNATPSARFVADANDRARVPDVTVLLDVAPETALARVKKRGTARQPDAYDAADLAVYEARATTYRSWEGLTHVGPTMVQVPADFLDARSAVAEYVRRALDGFVFGDGA